LALCEGGSDHATAEGCGSDDGNAEFVAGGKDVTSGWAFDIAFEDRLVDLDGGDGGDGYGMTEGGGGNG
jgi:CO/xanthine dehydrogenase FAD-binding subunit